VLTGHGKQNRIRHITKDKNILAAGNRGHLDDEGGWVDAKSTPWTTRSLVLSLSDAKSNSSCPCFDERKGGAYQKLNRGAVNKGVISNIDWQGIFESDIGKVNQRPTLTKRIKDRWTMGWVDAKSTPWTTRSLVLSLSDAKSNSSCPMFRREKRRCLPKAEQRRREQRSNQ